MARSSIRVRERATMELREDDPGRRLRLECVDGPVMSVGSRLGCLTVILVALVAFAVALYLTAERAPFVIFTAVAVLVAIPVALLTVLRLHRTLSFDLSRPDGAVRFEIGHPGKPEKAGTLDMADVDHVFLAVLKAESNVRDLPFRLRLHGDRRDPSLFEATLVVKGLDDEAAITAFFMKMARVIGLEHYRVLVRDPKRYELRLLRRPEDRSEPVGASPGA